MRIKRSVGRIISMVMVFAMIASLVLIPAFAEETRTHLDGSTYTLEKVSNPDRGEGEIDGLLPGGDRASSYCWAMAENDGYLYIGTWANGLWQMVEAISSTGNTLGANLSKEQVDKVAALITHGEVDRCEDDSFYTAKIFRYCEATGEIELLFDPGDHAGDPNYGVITGFRAGVEFKGDVYMDALLTGRCLLYRVTDENPYDLPEIVFQNGTLRAMCVSLDGETMFVGGSSTIPEGYLSSASIFATTTGNSGDYKVVADEKDFAYYTKTGATADISDMITFKNPNYKNGYELIATLGTDKGLVVYRGHAASDAETAKGLANEHGWVWTEFAGENGVYPISFGNPIHCNLNPVVFNDELYFLTMTNPMTPLIYLFSGLVSNNQQLFYYGLDQTALTCDIECSVYRLTNDGQLQMVMGDKEYCPDCIEYVAQLGAGFTNEKYGTTMYAWRGITYNNRLYVNTIDYWNLFSYVTQLTNGELLGMDKDHFKSEIGYIVDFLGMLNGKGDNTNAIDLSGIMSILTKAGIIKADTDVLYDYMYLLYSNIDKQASSEFLSKMIQFSVEYSDDISALCDNLLKLLNSGILNEENSKLIKGVADSIRAIQEPIANIAANKTHIENYMIISDTVANEKNPGGEVWCTADGVTWEAITKNGFNDKYNHGIRTFALGDDGALYYGCANPYYGAQLWKHMDSGMETPIPTPGPDKEFPFVDVPENAWYRGDVEYVWENGLMLGVSADKFAPNQNMTRAMFAQVLYRMEGCPDVSGLTMPFTDINKNHWAYDAVLWAYNAGVTVGTSDTTFSPNKDITRAQLVTMLYRYEGKPAVSGTIDFIDAAAIQPSYVDAIKWATANKIVNGYDDGTFRPNDFASRAHMAAILARYCKM